MLPHLLRPLNDDLTSHRRPHTHGDVLAGNQPVPYARPVKHDDAAPSASPAPGSSAGRDDAPAVPDQPRSHLTGAVAALRQAVIEVEAHMSDLGWDGPVGVFALVRTAAALREDPQLRAVLDPEALRRAEQDEHALTVIEQEDLPPASDLEDLLAHLAWPTEVDGVALSVERVVVPPAVEQEAARITDEGERLSFLATHPGRQDVRIVAGVLREGGSWCAVRTRAHDSADAVAQGADLVPGLIEALSATLS